ncbi:outer membrane beta-barrel protein [Pedobacter sp. Hv1]|uniref:outer membrane beta-barrel protein n=1 Tax=Pedobacter sp. Hv1 TaxID=1740090 RepID=UPI0006D8D398|nr:outer membrane beta-barrel protein [Pedobacter sp. Hv1]KQC00661.1 hypothetical protein AQF98_08235 [Pedobacter sp. Hv1]
MKKILLFSLISFVYFNVNAQTVSQKSSIGITVGPSFPVGDFASKDLSNSQSGLAKVGGFLGIDYSYRFSKYFGAIVSAQGRIHGVDEKALSTYAVPDGSGASLSIATGTWKMGAIMAGIFQVVPLTKDEKLNLEIRALGGYQSTSSPKVDVKISIPGMGSFQDTQESESAGSFAYVVGAGLKYSLSPSLALKLSGDYNGAQPKFTVTTYPADAPVTQQVKQSIGTFNVGIGLAIGF